MKAGAQAAAGKGARAILGAPAQISSTTQPGDGLFSQVLQGGSQAVSPLAGALQGLSDQDVPAAIEGAQEASKLLPQEPELPTSGKEMEYFKQLLARNPAEAKFYYETFLKKQPQTVVNNIPQKGETKFSEQLGENDANAIKLGEETAASTHNGFPAMAEAYKLVNRSFTGFGANQILQLARVAGTAGFKPSKDKVADTQTMVKLLRDQTLAYLQTRALGSETAVSDKDREFMERQSAADITLDPQSIKRIIRVNVGTGIEKTEAVIQTLKQAQVAYPSNAQQLEAKRIRLQKQVDEQWKVYRQMLKDEEAAQKMTQQRLGGTADAIFGPASTP